MYLTLLKLKLQRAQFIETICGDFERLNLSSTFDSVCRCLNPCKQRSQENAFLLTGESPRSD